MKIVRFSTPKTHNHPYSDQKISLAKLSQLKPQTNIPYGQQNTQQSPTLSNTQIKKPPRESHIKWVQDPVTGAILNEAKALASPKNIPRRKIFQEKTTSIMKQNIQIPTFTQMPSVRNIPDHEQTHYYSMVVNSPKQGPYHQLISSNISESKQYRSPFTTNQDNTRIDSQNAAMFNSNTNSIEKSSIAELTEYHIPRLEQKLKEHDKELLTIKKYLKNTEQISALKEEIHDYQEVQSFVEKQNQIERKRQLLMLSIQEAKARQRLEMKRQEDEVDSRIEQIEQQRLRRLEKIQKQNQRLYENLKYYSHDDDPQFESNPHQDYNFQGPVAFPSKDWQSQRQIIAPSSNDFHRVSNTTDNFRKHRNYHSGDMEISPILKKQVHQISSIGFSNNKTESFSLEANTFREIMSPLEFQGENETW